jgi:threonine/homoserine/homoserine lactone efflux protein
MDTIFPASFWPLALAHGFALLCPGPDFMLIVSHGMRHRLRGSAFICLGIAAGNAAYIALAILGWAGLSANRTFQRPLEIIGALYLAWLGVRIFRSARPLDGAGTETEERAAAPLSAPKQFAMGFGSAVLNPKNMVFYLTIMTVLIENDALLRQRIAAGAWMFSVVLLWDVFVAAIISRETIRRTLWKWIPLIEKICGAFLLFVAASVLYSL